MLLTEKARKQRDIYIHIFYDLSFSNYKDVHGKREVSAPEAEILMYLEMMEKEPIYRISINEDGSVETTCYEMMDAFAPQLKKWYESIDELPKWVQDKIAVLMLLDHTQTNKEIKNVGRRINRTTYWVFTGETNGDNPRG